MREPWRGGASANFAKLPAVDSLPQLLLAWVRGKIQQTKWGFLFRTSCWFTRRELTISIRSFASVQLLKAQRFVTQNNKYTGMGIGHYGIAPKGMTSTSVCRSHYLPGLFCDMWLDQNCCLVPKVLAFNYELVLRMRQSYLIMGTTCLPSWVIIS